MTPASPESTKIDVFHDTGHTDGVLLCIWRPGDRGGAAPPKKRIVDPVA